MAVILNGVAPSPTRAARHPLSAATLEHIAFLYRSPDEYVAGIRSFLEPAWAEGDAVVVAVPGDRHALLRGGLGGRDQEPEYWDMTQLGRNPGRIIGAVHDVLRRSPARALSYVGEPIWAGRSGDEGIEATHHEALINTALAGLPIRVLCPYDAVGLDPELLGDAECTHPAILDGGACRASERYASGDSPDSCRQPLAAPPADALALDFAADDLPAVRGFVRTAAGAALGARVEDLVLVINELATNTIRHAGGHGTLRLWHHPRHVVSEVADAGWIADALVGRRRAEIGATSGRGLWLVHQLSDLVQMRTGPGGTRTRVHMLRG